MSLPRVLSLGADGRLRMNPPREIENLRFNGRRHADLAVKSDSDVPIEGMGGRSLELAVNFKPGEARQFGLKVCASPDGEEQTLVYYDAAEKKLKVDTTKSSTGPGPRGIEAGPLELAPGEPLQLRVFIDKSVVEVFANGRQAVMRRIYPTRPDSTGVALFSRNGDAQAASIEAWEMMPSNPY